LRKAGPTDEVSGRRSFSLLEVRIVSPVEVRVCSVSFREVCVWEGFWIIFGRRMAL
jgi:hypothetical protein